MSSFYRIHVFCILNIGSANQRRKAGADDTGYCNQPMIADWKLELMGKKILELVFQDKRDLIDHTCDMIRKFGTFTVTTEDAKEYLYSFSTTRCAYKFQDIKVNLYI